MLNWLFCRILHADDWWDATIYTSRLRFVFMHDYFLRSTKGQLVDDFDSPKLEYLLLRRVQGRPLFFCRAVIFCRIDCEVYAFVLLLFWLGDE